MALNLLIPRIEWNDIVVAGTSHTTNVIDGISDVSQIAVGMTVSGSGIQDDTTVLSKGANSVTLSKATTSSVSVNFTFFNRFDFTYPPIQDTDENGVSNSKETRSLTGVSQVQFNYLEWQRDVTFDFLTEDEKNTLKSFFSGWGVYGYEFRYFYDKADSAYVDYSFRTRNLSFKRTVKKHPYFLYQAKFQFKRVE